MNNAKFEYDGQTFTFNDLLKRFDNGVVLLILCENLAIGQSGTMNDKPIKRIS